MLLYLRKICFTFSPRPSDRVKKYKCLSNSIRKTVKLRLLYYYINVSIFSFMNLIGKPL